MTCCCCPQAFPPTRNVKDINVRKTILPRNMAHFTETDLRRSCFDTLLLGRDLAVISDPSDNEPEARFVKASNVLWVKEANGKKI